MPLNASVGKMTFTMTQPNAPPYIQCRDHAFYLDLDGTLAPIAEQPEQAAVPQATRDLLVRLSDATEGAVAIVSGRSLAEVDRILAPLTLRASGTHGAELRGAGETPISQVPLATLRAAADEIGRFAEPKGLLVEPKPTAVALHYRTAPQHADACRMLIETMARSASELRALHGKMVSELTLAAFDKGTAIARFSRTAPFKGRLPVMVGDDVTDEDGFRAAQAQGGMGIKIGEGATVARYRLASVPAFGDWLASLLA